MALVLVLCALVATAPRTALGDTSLCCPADLGGDGDLDGADLGVLLAAWDTPDADLNGDGTTDGADLGILLAAWGPCPTRACLVTEIVGTVQFADGTPVADAVIVTDQGGKGVSGSDGSFAFTLELATKSSSLQVTAVATIGGVNYTGSKKVAPVLLGGVTDAGAITVTSGGCEGELNWLPTLGGAPGVVETVYALTTFDDGSGGGPALFAGGMRR